MLANIYQVRCKRCKRVATVAARIKPVTVTFTPVQAKAALAAISCTIIRQEDIRLVTVEGIKSLRKTPMRNAFARLSEAIKQQTKPRRKSK